VAGVKSWDMGVGVAFVEWAKFSSEYEVKN